MAGAELILASHALVFLPNVTDRACSCWFQFRILLRITARLCKRNQLLIKTLDRQLINL
jgi:hypothetical protein